MTKLEKLQKEYRKTMLDMMVEDGSPEMHQALYNKSQRLYNEIQEQKIRATKRSRRK